MQLFRSFEVNFVYPKRENFLENQVRPLRIENVNKFKKFQQKFNPVFSLHFFVFCCSISKKPLYP